MYDDEQHQNQTPAKSLKRSGRTSFDWNVVWPDNPALDFVDLWVGIKNPIRMGTVQSRIGKTCNPSGCRWTVLSTGTFWYPTSQYWGYHCVIDGTTRPSFL